MAVITIGGNLGAGKTTLAADLAKKLGYEELYMGKIFRDLAEERGLDIEALYDKLKNDPELEKSIDDRQAAFMREHDNTIVQGRIAWFFAKQSPYTVINLFLAVSPEIGAARSKERPEYHNKTVEEVMAANAFRAQLELERYKKLYGIENFLDPSHYDVIIDTTHLAKNEVLEKVLSHVESRQPV